MKIVRKIFTTLTLSMFPLTISAQNFEKGFAAYDRREFDIAFQELRPLAEQGNAYAQYILGFMYLKGDGVLQDDAEGLRWLRMAAAQGVPEYNLPITLPSVQSLVPIPGHTGFGDENLTASTVKIVNFTASWCAPCINEFPYLQELRSKVPTYGIFYKDVPGNAFALLVDHPSVFSAAMLHGSDEVALNWGLYGIPETFVIDENGDVVFRRVGPLTRDILDLEILPFIQNAEVWSGGVSVSVNSPD